MKMIVKLLLMILAIIIMTPFFVIGFITRLIYNAFWGGFDKYKKYEDWVTKLK